MFKFSAALTQTSQHWRWKTHLQRR